MIFGSPTEQFNLSINLQCPNIIFSSTLISLRFFSFLFSISYGTHLPKISIIILMKDKYCLNSIVSFETLNHSPTNKSSTKQTFSFSKSSRFQPIRSNCPMSTYGGEKVLRKDSGTSLGYGTKVDWTKNFANSPQSTKYNFKTIFDFNRQKKLGYSIGTSRQKILVDCYIDPNKLRNPGIGRYNLELENSVKTAKAPSFSMRIKTKVHDLTKTIESQNNNPSPAHYQNNPELSKTLYSSHFSRIGYSNTKSKRFLNSDNKIPGPAHYQNATSLSNVGKYVISEHRGGTNAKFDSAPRKTKFDEVMKISSTKPGPGDYRAASEFGIYDGEVYGRLIKHVGNQFSK